MNRIRFVHTSDVHLDTSFAGSGFPPRLGHKKREAIRATFRRILEDASRLEVDLVVIAGDLFEHDRIIPDTVEFLKQQFEALGEIPVFISPGNHDPYLRGSPYHDEVWPSNVHIFREERFTSVELPGVGVRVTGFGFNRTELQEHHFAGLPSLPPDGVNIVVSHGSDLARVPEGKARHGPFRIEEIAGKNIHYCALGHYHQQRQVANAIDPTQVWYCGIPEGRGWDETGSRGYILGEIEDGLVRVEGVVCNRFPLEDLALNCDGFTSREQIIEAVSRHLESGPGPDAILRVRLEGYLDSRLDLSTVEMEERLAGQALFIQWVDRTVPAIDFGALAEERTLCGVFVRKMNERIAAAGPGERDVVERARLYGTQALLGHEVRLR